MVLRSYHRSFLWLQSVCFNKKIINISLFVKANRRFLAHFLAFACFSSAAMYSRMYMEKDCCLLHYYACAARSRPEERLNIFDHKHYKALLMRILVPLTLAPLSLALKATGTAHGVLSAAAVLLLIATPPSPPRTTPLFSNSTLFVICYALCAAGTAALR